MGKLTDLLKADTPRTTTLSRCRSTNLSESDTSTAFDISDEDLEQVRSEIVEISTVGKNRRQIIIGMFGSIKDPTTGKRYIIPGVDCITIDYIYRYAEMMRTLVNKPADFKKIMNWE